RRGRNRVLIEKTWLAIDCNDGGGWPATRGAGGRGSRRGGNRPPPQALRFLLLMNIHHLEVFYYVGRHGGITEAVRNIPYGIQQGGKARQIRIGASTIVWRDHLPDLFQNVRKRFLNLKIALREGYQAELEILLQREDPDLLVTLIDKKSAPGIHSVALLELP